jgi:hypothetical protein
MIAEKIDAFADAEVALLNALAHGEGFAIAAERAYLPVRWRVHANSHRLLCDVDHDAANALLKASGMTVAAG